MILYASRRRTHHQHEEGYVLLVLILMMALIAIAAATALTSIKFNLRRDREEEMIHRGTQYSRAIRSYYKKFGRYPASIENLVNTNQLRFLRKRYKDPITGKDFRPLHFGEVKIGIVGSVGGGVIPGASTVGANGTLTNTSGTSNSSPGQNANQSSDSNSTGTDTQNASDNGSNSSGDQNSSDQPPQTFGGMPIVGVASTSRTATIREFDKKRKYSEWLFVYDPTMDRGLLITTPYQPQQLFGLSAQPVNVQQSPTPGLGTGAPGTVANPGPTTGPTSGNPTQPTDTPVQQ